MNDGPAGRIEPDADAEFDALVCAITVQIESGERVDWDSIGREHPRYVERLRVLMPTLEAMGALGASRCGERAHHPLGDTEQARKFFDRSVAWMEKNPSKNDDQLRFRAEAEKLLGLEPGAATPKTK
jgi:hypothetical protein